MYFAVTFLADLNFLFFGIPLPIPRSCGGTCKFENSNGIPTESQFSP